MSAIEGQRCRGCGGKAPGMVLLGTRSTGGNGARRRPGVVQLDAASAAPGAAWNPPTLQVASALAGRRQVGFAWPSSRVLIRSGSEPVGGRLVWSGRIISHRAGVGTRSPGSQFEDDSLALAGEERVLWRAGRCGRVSSIVVPHTDAPGARSPDRLCSGRDGDGVRLVYGAGRWVSSAGCRVPPAANGTRCPAGRLAGRRSSEDRKACPEAAYSSVA